MKKLTIIGAAMTAIMLSGCAVTTAGVSKGDERNLARSIDDASAGRVIKARMKRVDDFDLKNVNVEVAEGIVVLTGSVPTQRDRAEAERVAWSAPKIVQVGNELILDHMADNKSRTKDNIITTSVKRRLITKGSVKARNVNVETYRGTVYLLGVARNPEELKKIAEIASKTKGVQNVISYIKLDGETVQTTGYPSHAQQPLAYDQSQVHQPQINQTQINQSQVAALPPANTPPSNEPFYRDPVTGEIITLPPGTKTIPYNPGAAGLGGVPTVPQNLPNMGGVYPTSAPGNTIPAIESAPYYIDSTTGELIPAVLIGD